VLPLVFMFLLGIVWFGRAFNIYTTITQAAQQGAITAARASSVNNGNAPAPDGDPTTPGSVVFAVTSVMQASNLDPNQIVANSSPTPGCTTTPSKIMICRNLQLNVPPSTTQPQFCTSPPSPSQICGTLVSFKYPYQFDVPFTSLNSVLLVAQAENRMEK